MKGGCLLLFSRFLEMISFWIVCGVMDKISCYNLEDPKFKNHLIQTYFYFKRSHLTGKIQGDNFCKLKNKSLFMCIHFS